jgi:excisionase family DNA binding protein
MVAERKVITTPDDSINPRHSGGMTRAELLALPVTVDVATAARALGLGRSTGYELARRGEFPCRVLRVGGSYRVPTADLLRVLGIAPDEPNPLPPAA